MKSYAAVALSAAMLAGTVNVSFAQENKEQEGATWVDITVWDTTGLRQGWSADNLLNEEVYGSDGDQIGEVEDFFMGPEGQIISVVVEGGGVLDIGDSHIAVPWGRVNRLGPVSIQVPVEDGNLDEFGLFENVDDDFAAGRKWRLSDLIGDYVTLKNGINYGYVEDVIFNDKGTIQAVIADPAYGYGYSPGPVAFPYNTAYDPYTPYYPTPYTKAQLQNLKPFRYSELQY